MTVYEAALGIDVSGAHLDACLLPTGAFRRVTNTTAGIAKLVAWAASGGVLVVLEATAPYDQPLIRALEMAGLPFHRANPKRARDFARSLGLLAKTDRVDARMLAEFGLKLQPAPTPPADPNRLALAALTSRRDQLVAMRKAEATRLKPTIDPVLIDSLKATIAMLTEQIRIMDRRIHQLIKTVEHLARDNAILRSATGVGAVCAAVLLSSLPELGRVDRRAVAALAGLAPIARESGTLRGQRHVGGGRKRVRDALYMAALTAAKHGRWKAEHERLKQTGKPPKKALIALARKLLVALNAAVKAQTPILNHAPA